MLVRPSFLKRFRISPVHNLLKAGLKSSRVVLIAKSSITSLTNNSSSLMLR